MRDFDFIRGWESAPTQIKKAAKAAFKKLPLTREQVILLLRAN